MKTIKCSQVGGEGCTFEATAETPEEVKTQMGEHAQVAHAEMMAKATPDDMSNWNKMFDKLWEETPESA
ncbi:MAG: DUF1059 domain-containing protein [Parcubacteria group bacterium]|nr:DUF1059 domain-containing protein [Parcubacteria group bacterium]